MEYAAEKRGSRPRRETNCQRIDFSRPPAGRPKGSGATTPVGRAATPLKFPLSARERVGVRANRDGGSPSAVAANCSKRMPNLREAFGIRSFPLLSRGSVAVSRLSKPGRARYLSPMQLRQPHAANRTAWDERVRRRAAHTTPVTRADLENPYALIDDLGWLGGNVRGRRVLCLAAGGGRHGVLFAAAGAEVTVVDLSPAMLEIDREQAATFGLKVRTVEASMDDLAQMGDGAFDLVIQPVSTCYVSDLRMVYREVARVTAADGVYVSQHKQPGTLQAALQPLPGGSGYLVTERYDRTGPLPEVLTECQHRELGTLEYLHRWQDLLGELCRSGFVIEDLVEPAHANPAAAPGSFGHRACFLPPFVTVKARRVGSAAHAAPRLWLR